MGELEEPELDGRLVHSLRDGLRLGLRVYCERAFSWDSARPSSPECAEVLLEHLSIDRVRAPRLR
jgi:hypothetical protein